MTSLLTPPVVPAEAAAQLRAQITGPVVLPGDDGYDAARAAWNLAVDQRPAVVVTPASADEVVVALRFARATSLTVAVQATGHGVTRAADGALLLRTGALDTLEIDAVARRARIGAGLTWGPVLAAAQAHGLAPLLGSAPHVGAVGYTLGGGMGWLARAHGLAADRVVSFELVTPDGTVHQVDRHHEADVFDALRGAGAGSLGVVTAMEVELVPVTMVTGGNLLYPIDMAREVMARFRDWAPTLPDTFTAAVTLMHYPPFEQVPEPVRGRSFILVRGCHCGDADEAAALLDHWRGWHPPVLDAFGPMPFTEVATISQDPVDPIPGAVTSEVVGDLPDDVIHAVVAASTSPDGPPPVIFTEARLLGGAIGRGDSPAGERLRDARYVVESVAVVPAPEMAPEVEQALAGVRRAVAPVATGAAYLNFLEDAERRRRTADAMTPVAVDRLRDLQRRLDPDGVMAHGLRV